MDSLDVRLGGLSLAILLGICGAWYLLRGIFENGDSMGVQYHPSKTQAEFKAEHIWQPRMVSGIDCGEWVRKDGQPFKDRSYT